MLIDFTQLSAGEAYHTMTQSVIPRPVAWVLSEHANGSLNLAPFSFFTAITANPPLLMFSSGKKSDGEFKDTVRNIQQQGRFTLHIGQLQQLEALNASSMELGFGESEIERLDLSVKPFISAGDDDKQAPDHLWQRLEQAPIAFACELFEIQEIGNTPQQLVFGLIKQMYVDEACCEKDAKGRLHLSAEKIDPILRLGAKEYAELGRLISLARP